MSDSSDVHTTNVIKKRKIQIDSSSDFEGAQTKEKTTKKVIKPKTTTAANVKAKPKAAMSIAEKLAMAKPKVIAIPDTTDKENTTINIAAEPKTETGAKRTVEQIYQKKSQLEHILLRPDTYIGSIEDITQPMWVLKENCDGITQRNITYVPGFYKIFDEILVNAADNKQRDNTMNELRVVIDKAKNTISVQNNGAGVPIQMHAEEKVWVPELIFGQLLTSSNYDDDDKKVTGGRNGYGAKLTNIYSTQFIVETADSKVGKKYRQVFYDNMSRKDKPSITAYKSADYTKITFQPDLQRFKLEGITDDFEALLKKRVYDLAGVLRGVKVFLNEERIKIKSFKEYVELYLKQGEEKVPIVHEIISDRWEIAFAMSEGTFQQVSFCNSICTSKGGTHVDYIAKQLTDKLVAAIKSKKSVKKEMDLKPQQVKNHMWIFINTLIENPAFDSQTKENMTLKASAFGSKCDINEDFIGKVVKTTTILDTVLSWARFKQDQLLKKTDGTKRARISGILKLEDANDAGTKNGQYCTLIITEGDSAKSTAVSGLAVVGRDRYGVFPLRGKVLNVRDANNKQIADNVEITHLKQILGLRQGQSYQDVKTLRYGHVMIMADQDHDGSHIKGLVMNLFDNYWPDLLRQEGFMLQFITPIVKVKKRTQEINFFTLREYETWREETPDAKRWTAKYFKGLGTSTSEQAQGYFSNLDLHAKKFSSLTEEDRALLDMAFNKKKADDRKEWLRGYVQGSFMDYNKPQIAVSEFVNSELIQFSMADNIRSLPSAIDGLKPGLRKIIYSCFKKGAKLIKEETKVAQLAAMVAAISMYHHGETALAGSIVGLAQDFVGSNNMNMLRPIGQFGTRLQGGKDAASSRYIYTQLEALTRKVYHPADDAILNYLDEDGDPIEPNWYIPVIPMLLVNGSEGIGTGWSTSVPNYNPHDIIENLRRLLRDEEPVEMTPWYRGFKGTIERQTQDKYLVSGSWNKIDDTTLEITELPIKTWTQTYKEFLESLVTGSDKQPAILKDYKEYHTDVAVKFVLTMSEEAMAAIELEGVEKKLKLTSSISTSNMVCFDSESRIKKYRSAEELLRDFYDIRLQFYHKRKEYMVDQLSIEATRASERVRFIKEVIAGTINIRNRKRAELVAELKSKKYQAYGKAKPVGSSVVADDGTEADVETRDTEEDQADEEATSGSDYDYLVGMPMWNLTKEKVEKHIAEQIRLQNELDLLLSTPVKNLWLKDLDEVAAGYDQFLIDYETRNSKKVTMKGKGGRKPPVMKKQIKAPTISPVDLPEEKKAVKVPSKASFFQPITKVEPKAAVPSKVSAPIKSAAASKASMIESMRAKAKSATISVEPSSDADFDGSPVVQKERSPIKEEKEPTVIEASSGSEFEGVAHRGKLVAEAKVAKPASVKAAAKPPAAKKKQASTTVIDSSSSPEKQPNIKFATSRVRPVFGANPPSSKIMRDLELSEDDDVESDPTDKDESDFNPEDEDD